MNLNQHEPPPTPSKSELPFVWDLVRQDMVNREEYGVKKYGVRLQPFNDRNALIDAYQEALDLVVYLRTAIYEKYGE